MRARKLAALVLAVVLAVLAGGDVAAYAGTSKTCAPRTAIREALTRREGRDMAVKKKPTAPAANDNTDTSLAARNAAAVRLAHGQDIERARAGRYQVSGLSVEGAKPHEVAFPQELAFPLLTGLLFDEETGAFVGELAAGRLILRGEKTPLDSPSARKRGRWVTPTDAALVRELLQAVAYAVQYGTRARLDKLPEAVETLLQRPKGKQQKLVSFADDLAMWARNFPKVRHVWPRELLHASLGGSIERMAKQLDPAFAKLSVERLEEAISRDIAGDPKRRGGRGNVEATLVAAQLIYEVEAFGYTHVAGEPLEKGVSRIKGHIEKARDRARAASTRQEL